jgi:hypothetical protein
MSLPDILLTRADYVHDNFVTVQLTLKASQELRRYASITDSVTHSERWRLVQSTPRLVIRYLGSVRDDIA